MARTSSTERARRPTSEPSRGHSSPSTTGPAPSLLRLGAALGNHTTTALVAGGLLQRKLAIGPADDPLEREADRVADRVLSARGAGASSVEGAAGLSPTDGAAAAGAAQRACAGCDPGHPCAECAAAPDLSEAAGGTVQRLCTGCDDEDELQRDAAAGEGAGSVSPAQVESRLGGVGPGRPLAPELRGFFEPRFDHDFGAVRLHTGTAADAAARAARARAFTLGSDVVFAAGEYPPSLGRGRRLLAHELAHVVQQTPGDREPTARRQVEAPAETVASPPEPAPAETPDTEGADATAKAPAPAEAEAGDGVESAAPRGLIVADDAPQPSPEQMTRTAFLDELHTAACAAADAGLAGTDRSSRGCPYIDHYFRLYRKMSPDRIEADLLRYVPGARGARRARDYIAPAAEHIRASVERWAETGELTGVPEGLPGMGLLGAIGGSLAGLGRLLFKARAGGPAGSAAPPAAVAASLGPGSSFSGTARSRMEGAFGTGLGDVRLHTDTTASRLASRFDARAFTVGPHVAFGAGEFRPGTLAGDALIAHEVAHVLQQDGEAEAASVGEPAGLERDADLAAAGVAARLLQPERRGKAMRSRRRTPLRLQRCSKDEDKKVKGRPGMGLGPGLAPGVETKSYSMSEYIRMWEQAAGRKMSDGERRRLAAGCVGITRLNLGGAASLAECYATFDQAKKRADELQRLLGKRPFIFSKRFWSMGASYTPDPATGKVDMSGYTGAMPPGEVNFDYGWYDEINKTWWHANHCDPVVAGGTCAAAYDATQRMKVYQSTLAHYSDPTYFGADVQVFCVAWSQLQ